MQLNEIQNNFTIAWQDELKEAITNHSSLEKALQCNVSKTPYPIFIPPHVLKRIKQLGINSPYSKTYLPQEGENINKGFLDPIGDIDHSPNSGIVHRYPNRILFMPTTFCPVMCRHCFRKNLLAGDEKTKLQGSLKKLESYLEKHSEIEEVILTGGDPLILSDSKLELIINSISKFSHVRFFRIHTKTPLVLPSRVNSGLISVLKKACDIFDICSIALHVNHSSEFDSNVITAILQLKEILGLKLLTQTVLLNDINDDPQVLKELFLNICKLGMTPYYLHHTDKVKGGAPFFVDLEKGRKIYLALRSILPGWAIPQYIIDGPGGTGKIPAFNPEQFAFSGTLLSKDAYKIDSFQ